MKIFIDANIYLDFYRSNKDALLIFDELIKNADSIILTNQIRDEFMRNREVVLKYIKAKFNSEYQIQSFSSTFLKSLSEFEELIILKEKYNLKRKEIEDIIDSVIENPTSDPVAVHFDTLCNANGLTILETSDKIIDQAYKRKLKGNPPVSEKYSIGDEINWELLLENLNDDLVIVGRDKTYTENINFLKMDYERGTNKKVVFITDRITKAIEELGKNPSEELKELENNQLKDLLCYAKSWDGYRSTPFLTTTNLLPDYLLYKTDESVCGNCGLHGPWNGNQCLTCGSKAFD